jgi:hypothetical protein
MSSRLSVTHQPLVNPFGLRCNRNTRASPSADTRHAFWNHETQYCSVLTLAPWLYPTVSSWFRDDGVFFRLKASYLRGSERIDFDIVVGCNVRVTAYKDGEESYDAVRDPLFFVKATQDGGALLQIVPNACLGQTTQNRDVPKDFLPGAIWFESKDDFSFGIGYVTEDAFESPRSKLKFLGATITKASRREWEAFSQQLHRIYYRLASTHGEARFPGRLGARFTKIYGTNPKSRIGDHCSDATESGAWNWSTPNSARRSVRIGQIASHAFGGLPKSTRSSAV